MGVLVETILGGLLVFLIAQILYRYYSPKNRAHGEVAVVVPTAWGHCIVCDFWKADAHVALWGTCQRAVDDLHTTRLFYVVAHQEEDTALHTHANFGCVGFAAQRTPSM